MCHPRIASVPADLTVNGNRHRIDDPPGVSLLEVLRDRIGLTGAKYGCGEARCGACVVLLEDKPVASCVTALADAAGKRVTTVEGLSAGSALHPVQQAFVDSDALQCGYCTPGMVVAATALLRQTARPTREQIVAALQPHVCRCGAYARIVAAVQLAAQRIAGAAGAAQ